MTLLFVDLSGSSRLAELLDAEQVADILEAFRHICREVVSHHGGLIARMQGDGALAVFGHPAPGEDDGRRAVEAALEVHARVERLDVAPLPDGWGPLQVHSGVHCGLVLVAEGDIELGRIELIGDAPNIASRLSSLAPAGAIFADEAALGPHRGFFHLGPEKLMPLRGRLEPVRVVPVLGRSGLERRFDGASNRGLTPFVGRGRTLDTVAVALKAAAANRTAQLIQVRGEAGIGKTRLLEEIARLPEAAGFECLRGYCESYLGAEVLQPFAQIERFMAGRAAPAEGGAGRRPSGQAAPILDSLAEAAARQPVLLLLDDWQWADDACRQLLDGVLQLRLPIAVVLAARPMADAAEARGGADLIELSPFSEKETRATVARWLSRADPFVVAEIHQYAGGVPLLVEELCHSYRASGALGASGARGGSAGWLSSAVASRLGRLPSSQQHLVRVAAVLGTVFPRSLFERVQTLDGAEHDLAALADADFVFPAEGDMLRFKHGLTRDAVFETVGLRERRAIHLRVVEVLAAAPEAHSGMETLEALAYHARAAGLWADAARHCEQAGDKAAQAYAFDRARAQYLAALDALDRRGGLGHDETLHWCALAHKLGMTCIFDPLALPDALQLFERCLALARAAGDTGTLARSEYWMGYMCYGFGRPRVAAAHCREALRLARSTGDTRLAAQVEATLAQALAAACEYEESLFLMDRALGAKRQGVRAGSGVAVGSAFTLACKASVLADRGDFALAHRALDEAKLLLGDSVHPVANSVRNWTMVILAWQGRWDDAIRVSDEGMRIAERSRALLPLAISRAVGGYARWKRDGSAPDLEQAAEAVHWMEQRRGTFFTSIYYGWLVEGCVAQQRTDEARRHAARLLVRAHAGERLGEAVGCRALALACEAAGDLPGMQRHLRRAEASARQRASRREQALNELCQAELLRRQGAHDLATLRASAAANACRAMDMSWHALQAEGA